MQRSILHTVESTKIELLLRHLKQNAKKIGPILNKHSEQSEMPLKWQDKINNY